MSNRQYDVFLLHVFQGVGCLFDAAELCSCRVYLRRYVDYFVNVAGMDARQEHSSKNTRPGIVKQRLSRPSLSQEAPVPVQRHTLVASRLLSAMICGGVMG